MQKVWFSWPFFYFSLWCSDLPGSHNAELQIWTHTHDGQSLKRQWPWLYPNNLALGLKSEIFRVIFNLWPYACLSPFLVKAKPPFAKDPISLILFCGFKGRKEFHLVWNYSSLQVKMLLCVPWSTRAKDNRRSQPKTLKCLHQLQPLCLGSGLIREWTLLMYLCVWASSTRKA